MVPDQLIVNGRVEDVLDTWTHGGATFARVESGFVEVPDNPAEPKYAVYCEDCGHLEEQPNGRMALVDYKDHAVSHEGSAETLARIHEIKSGHDPEIRVRAA